MTSLGVGTHPIPSVCVCGGVGVGLDACCSVAAQYCTQPAGRAYCALQIGFISAGQEPAMLELQRALFAQLTGGPLAVHDSATPSTQRQQLQDAGAGKVQSSAGGD